MGRIGSIVGLTLVLGVSVFIAWSIALGRLAATGLGTVGRDQPVVVFGLVALFAAMIGVAAGLLVAGRWTDRQLALGVVAAWIGELIVLLVTGVLLENEITPSYAPALWVMATAGPLQPIVAIAGGVVGRRLRTWAALPGR